PALARPYPIPDMPADPPKILVQTVPQRQPPDDHLADHADVVSARNKARGQVQASRPSIQSLDVDREADDSVESQRKLPGWILTRKLFHRSHKGAFVLH